MELRCQVIAATGWTWDQVGRLTLPRLRALYRHWRRHPPTHLLLASWVGFEPPSDAAPVQTPAQQPDGIDPTAPAPLAPWLQGMRSVPASPALQEALTADQAVDAYKRMFFGDLHVFSK